MPTPELEDLWTGLGLFCAGFVKKILIADNVGVFSDTVFAHSESYGRAALTWAAIAYSVQIWADFSGYTDMGRGAARMLGFRLPENFLSPYLAGSPSEFWRRWHITLSQWIRDYIYFPLGGSRGKMLRVASVALLTMVLSGLWHGANWTFVAWGLYHGFLLVIERVARGRGLPPRLGGLWVRTLKTSLNLSLVMLGWILFRSASIGAAFHFLRRILEGASGTMPDHLGYVQFGAVFCILYQALSYYDLEENRYPVVEFVRGLPVFARSRRWGPAYAVGGFVAGMAMAILLAATLALRISDAGRSFIYFQF
jgi:alginate O-acetyltransferase complex protein AlgI